MNLLHPMFDDSLLFHPLTVSFASLINNLRLRIRKKTICCFANKEKKIKHRKKIIKKKKANGKANKRKINTLLFGNISGIYATSFFVLVCFRFVVWWNWTILFVMKWETVMSFILYDPSVLISSSLPGQLPSWRLAVRFSPNGRRPESSILQTIKGKKKKTRAYSSSQRTLLRNQTSPYCIKYDVTCMIQSYWRL